MSEIIIKDFFEKWGKDLDQVTHILQYLHTYPHILNKIEIEDLISPDELKQKCQEWISLYSKYEGMEKDFFKPYWISLQRNSYNYFLDISDNKYPVFSYSFFPFEPYTYNKAILFDSITDFMLLEDNQIDIEELRKNKFEELMIQIKNKIDKNY